ncbi:AAA domain-containing protein [Candidatus Woesearchaeota archaeon]|nr:AAA domain-containing protein [Candidatus Woesearchaeota archaeon]
MAIDKEFLDALHTSGLDDIRGQEPVKLALKSALLVERNVIIVGPPGIGKTTLAKNVARLLPEKEVTPCFPWQEVAKRSGEERFVRVQGSPDLTAEDLIGDIDPLKALKHGPLSPEAFCPGKIFRAHGGILFFDEINRCSDKLQNALLQVLEERKVTLGGYEMDFPAEFLFIGTMNPDDSSTEKLSDVFLDRFDLVMMGYPESAEIEHTIVTEQSINLEVEFPQPLLEGVIAFVRQLREDKNIEKRPSVRATLGVVDRAKAVARLRDGKRVTPQDVAAVIVSVLSHRISLKPSVKYLEDVETYVADKFAEFSTDHSLGGDG